MADILYSLLSGDLQFSWHLVRIRHHLSLRALNLTFKFPDFNFLSLSLSYFSLSFLPFFYSLRALEVITRVQAKLTGRDFATSPSDEEDYLTVEQQVDRWEMCEVCEVVGMEGIGVRDVNVPFRIILCESEHLFFFHSRVVTG